MKYLLVFVATIGLFLSACTFRTSSTNNPVIEDMQALGDSLNTTVTATEFNATGTSQNVNGVETNYAELTVYNAQGLPKGVMAKNDIALKLAKIFYKSIENKKDYNQINVTFLFIDGAIQEQQRLTFSPRQLR